MPLLHPTAIIITSSKKIHFTQPKRHTMNTSIMKPVSEVKNELGTYFKLIRTHDFHEISSIMERLDRIAFRTFPQKVELFYDLFTGKSKQEDQHIKLVENLYSKYGEWFFEDNQSVFMTKEDALKYVTQEIISNFNFFMKTAMTSFASKVADKDNMLKKLFMNSKTVKQLDFLKNNADKIQKQSVEKWLNINIQPAINPSVKEVKVPQNWNEALKDYNSKDFYTIHNEEIVLLKGCLLLHLSYESKNNSLYLQYELNNHEINISQRYIYLCYKEETNSFTFDAPFFFTKEEADVAYLKLITDKEAQLNKMKSKVAA